MDHPRCGGGGAGGSLASMWRQGGGSGCRCGRPVEQVIWVQDGPCHPNPLPVCSHWPMMVNWPCQKMTTKQPMESIPSLYIEKRTSIRMYAPARQALCNMVKKAGIKGTEAHGHPNSAAGHDALTNKEEDGSGSPPPPMLF